MIEMINCWIVCCNNLVLIIKVFIVVICKFKIVNVCYVRCIDVINLFDKGIICEGLNFILCCINFEIKIVCSSLFINCLNIGKCCYECRFVLIFDVICKWVVFVCYNVDM